MTEEQSSEDKKMEKAAKTFVQMYEVERKKVVEEARQLNLIDRNTMYAMLLKSHARISELEHAVEAFREWAKKVEKSPSSD